MILFVAFVSGLAARLAGGMKAKALLCKLRSKRSAEVGQAMIPRELTPETREFRRWEALGEARMGLMEIVSDATTIEQARKTAKDYIKRINIFCHAPHDSRSEP